MNRPPRPLTEWERLILDRHRKAFAELLGIPDRQARLCAAKIGADLAMPRDLLAKHFHIRKQIAHNCRPVNRNGKRVSA